MINSKVGGRPFPRKYNVDGNVCKAISAINEPAWSEAQAEAISVLIELCRHGPADYTD